jgi:histidine triad (HIT) family protein
VIDGVGATTRAGYVPFDQETGMAAGCVFCEIVSGKKEAQRVLEGEHVLAFLDARPLFPGHVLVIPKAHVETLADLDPSRLGLLFASVQRVMRGIEKGLGADGTFVASNNRVSQSVPHVHVHVVPRRKGDGLRGFFWPRQKYKDVAEATAIAEKIRSAICE